MVAPTRQGQAVTIALAPLQIRAPAVVLDGPRLGRRAAIALARLAVDRGQVVARDELADAIWGEELPSAWAASLRNAISRLRVQLEAAGVADRIAVRAVADGYRLELSPAVSVDVEQLAAAAAEAAGAMAVGDSARVLELARLALDVPDRPLLVGARGEWIEALRARAAVQREQLLRLGAEAALIQDQAGAAEWFARALVVHSPYLEDGHRQLMRALVGSGNRAAALAAYESCRGLLAEELGSTPSEATQAVFLDILNRGSDELAAAGTTRATPAAERLLLVQRQGSFVGRGALLRGLGRHLHELGRTGHRIVTLAGDPGMGKTRTAAELVADARAADMTVLYGRAEERFPIAFDAFLEALGGYLASVDHRDLGRVLGPHGPILARLLPSVAEVIAPAETTDIPDLDQQHATLAIERALRVAAGSSGALVVLDDMQWATSASIGVLVHLAAAAEPAPLLVLVLHRSVDDAAALGQLGSAERVRRLRLDPLAAADVEALIAAEAGPSQSGDRTAWIATVSGGNPLAVIELARSQPAGGVQARAAGTLDDVLRHRVESLPPGTARLLETAAVAGFEFDPTLIAAASDPAVASPMQFVAAMAAALVVPAVHRDGWLAFRHALIQAAVVEGLGPAEEMRLHARLGRALEARPIGSVSLARLAYHFGSAAPLGDWRRAVRYGRAAARAAFDDGIFEDAVAIASRSLQALDVAGDPDPAARIDLQTLLGGAQRALGEGVGYATLRAAFAAARGLEDPSRMAAAALAFSDAGAATDEAYIDETLLDVYREALAALGPGTEGARAQLLGHVACGTAWRQGHAAARPAVNEALRLVRSVAQPAIRLRVLTSARRALTQSLALDVVEPLEDQLFSLAEQLDDPGSRVRASLWRLATRVEQGLGRELETLLDVAERESADLRMGSYHHSTMYTRAALWLLRGDVAAADRAVEAAAETGARHGLAAPILEAIRLTQLVAVRREQGRLPELREEFVAFFGATGVPEWRGVIAFINAENGVLGDVESDLAAFFDVFDATGPSMISPVAVAASLAPAIERIRDQRRAASLYRTILPYRGRGGYFAQFSGPIDHALGVLARVDGRPAAAREHFRAGAAFSRRLGAPLWTRRCLAAAADP